MTTRAGYRISTDKSLLQRQRVHRFLSEEAYWCLQIPRDVVERAIEGSLCFGLYEEATGEQVGFTRVIGDGATFAYLCDVYVERGHRGRGLSKWLIETVLAHPQLQGLRRICLSTKDAHGLYEQFGIQRTQTPDYWMEIKDNELYKKLSRSSG